MVIIKTWLKDDAYAVASKLTAINKEHITEETISGFGMKSKVIKFIDLIRTAMFPNIYHEGINHDEFLDTVV